MATTWTRVANRTDIESGGRLVVRPGRGPAGRQLALFDTPDGVLACNNRCPHEGYPLSEGTLDGRCVLTCNWHNWKFDLTSGENLYGGDRLRTYPVEIRDEAIWVDLADPPFEERRAEALRNLRDAFDDSAYARMARELGRLRLIGADPLDAARAAIRWSHERMEFGWTHGYAALADWLVVHDENARDEEAMLACLLEAIGHIADDVLREAPRPYPPGREAYDEAALVDAIEREDEAAAIARVRGALAEGLGFDAIEPALARAALGHYSAFGHSAIYLTKAGRLIARLGPEVAEALLLALVRHIVFARREDLIPEFGGYADALARFARPGDGEPGAATVRPAPSMDEWRGLGIAKALEATVRASEAPPLALFDALLGANAHNLLAYDISRQSAVHVPVTDNVGWLDFTHPITFAAAIAELCGRHPDLWPNALAQLACFTGRNARYTTIAAPDGWAVDDHAAFFVAEAERVLDHDIDEFIVSVHRLKTLLAARELLEAGLSERSASTMLAGVNRYLHAPARLKHVRRTVYQALQFVTRDA